MIKKKTLPLLLSTILLLLFVACTKKDTTITYLKEADYIPAYPSLTLIQQDVTDENILILTYDSKEKDMPKFKREYKDLLLKNNWTEEESQDEKQLKFSKDTHNIILDFNQTGKDEYVQITIVAK